MPQDGPARVKLAVQTVGPGQWTSVVGRGSSPPAAGAVASTLRGPRPIVQPSAPGRYRVQFTIGRESHDELRRLQALLRREIPGGDPGLIFERALHPLLEKVEKAKLGRPGKGKRRVIRFETDNDRAVKDTSAAPVPRPDEASGDPAPSAAFRTEPARSRHIPAAVRAAVWKRDGARCAFVGGTGYRCIERSFLEFHHVRPFALQGPPTIGNIALRCRRHNQYEGELDFGPFQAEGSGGACSMIENVGTPMRPRTKTTREAAIARTTEHGSIEPCEGDWRSTRAWRLERSSPERPPPTLPASS